MCHLTGRRDRGFRNRRDAGFQPPTSDDAAPKSGLRSPPMGLSRATIVPLLVGVGLTVIGASPAHRTARHPLSPPDRVTVRVAFKIWGGELEQCTGMNWNW